MRAPFLVVFVAVLVVLLSSSVALSGPLDKGSHELSGRFTFDRTSYSHKDYDDTAAETVIEFMPSYGYFVADNWELAFGVPIIYASDDFWGDWSQTIYGAQFGVLYHFNGGGTTVPYVGAGLGLASASDSEDTEYETMWVLPALVGGLRVFFTDSACLNFEAYYYHQMNGLFAEDITGHQIGLRAGFSVFL